MRTSAFKRGLAVSAVAALAVTGMQTSASADSVDKQVTDGASDVVLYSQFNTGNEATVKPDGTDSTIHLEAGAAANIPAITFQYSLNGTDFIDIATVSTRNADGTFSAEWNGGGALGGTVTLRATGTPSGTNTAITDDVAGVEIQGGGTADNGVNITAGTTLPYFQQPYAAPNNTTTAVVKGTTSAINGNVVLSRRDGNGAAAGATTSAPVTVAQGATTGTFSGVLDLTGYPFDVSPSNAVNQIVVGAERDTDDVEAFTLKKQTITTVTAVADKTQVAAGGNATVTVTVVDADSAPIAGAEVRSSAGGAAQYTNADGKATFTQGAGAATFYYANADATAAYDAGAGDKKSADITVTSYTPAPTKLAGKSADGAAFDYDENAAGDITVQIQDQADNDFPTAIPRTIQYHWVITPFDGSPATVRQPTTGETPVVTDGTGKASIPLPTAAPAEAGTYELFAALQPLLGNGAIAESKVLTVKAGQAAISYDDASPQQVLAGTSAAVNGKLALADGTGLPGRLVNLAYTAGAETNPAGAGDAGLVQTNGTTGAALQVTTTATGAFTASVKDVAETPQPVELGGDLDATTANTPTIGNAGATKNDQKIDFVKSVTAGNLTIADPTPLDGDAAPGRPVNSSVTLKTAEGDVLANQNVTLKTDSGFFTTYAANKAALVADPAAASGADYGKFKNIGTEITVKTDAAGVANFTLAIEKDEDFDDDGKATANVTATAGAATASKAVVFESADPTNGGELKLEFSPEAIQESGVLPKAPTTDKVFFDVTATDQFGNKVGGETVTVPGVAGPITTDFALDGDFSVTSSTAQDLAVTASWVTDTVKYSAATPPVATPGTETLTDSETVNFYTVDYANSTFGLVHSPKGNVPVGTPVTVTYGAADQNGEPISNLYVQFFRSGPDNLQDGEGNFDGLTGQDGLIEYVFQGAKAGTATISAVGREGSMSGSLVPQAQKTDKVTFGAGQSTGKQDINAQLTLRSARGGDKVTVKAPRIAKGAKVRVYKIVRGKRVFVAKGNLGRRGVKTFTIKDRNGNGFTRYFAVVTQTTETKRDQTPIRKVR